MPKQKTTKPLWTNARAWWLLRVTMVSVVLVMASLVLSKHPVAAQSPARNQYEATEPTTSVPASPAEPGAETNTTPPPSDTQNESGDGQDLDPAQEAPQPNAPGNRKVKEDPSDNNSAPPSDSNGGQVPSDNTPSPGDPDAGRDPEASVPSILPYRFSQEGEPGTGNTTAPSVPQGAVEGLLTGLNKLHVTLNELLNQMMGMLPFEIEQPTDPEAETNTTPPPSDTQNSPVQQVPQPNNAPEGSEVTDVPSDNNSAPPSDTSGDQGPSGNTSSPGDPNAPWPESGCADPSAHTHQQAVKCEMDKGGMRTGDWGGMWLY